MNALQYRNLIEKRFRDHMNSFSEPGETPYRYGYGAEVRNFCNKVRKWMPPADREKIGKTPIGVAMLGGINAVSLLADDDSPLIIFDINLLALLHECCLALCDEAFIQGEGPGWETNAAYGAATPEERRIWFWDNMALNSTLTGMCIDQHWRIGTIEFQKRTFYDRMWFVQIWFIVAHELGHIVLGHLNEEHCRLRQSPLLGIGIRAYNESHEMEFEADKYAFDLLLGRRLPSWLQFERYQVCASIDVLFSLFTYLEGSGAVLSGMDPWSSESPTHPSGIARQERIRSYYGDPHPWSDEVRDFLCSYVNSFEQRWPTIQKTLWRQDGINNVCFL